MTRETCACSNGVSVHSHGYSPGSCFPCFLANRIGLRDRLPGRQNSSRFSIVPELSLALRSETTNCKPGDRKLKICSTYTTDCFPSPSQWSCAHLHEDRRCYAGLQLLPSFYRVSLSHTFIVD